MRRILRTSATVATALSIAGSSVAGVAGASSVTTQGPNSPIRIHARNQQTVRNDNDVSVNSSNSQDAYSGNAQVRNNTTGGNATSGMARNSNTTSTTVRIRNASLTDGMGSGNSDTVRTSGPNSPIRINLSNRTSVDNDNDVHVTNDSTQTASTGNASVSNNTTGGSARSGDATNTNRTVTSVTISN